MTMIRFNNNLPLTDLFENLFGNTAREQMHSRTYECEPSTNILENGNGFELQMAIPGVPKEDVKISLEKNVLSISSEKEMGKDDENVKYTRREFVYGTFCRSFTIPETVDVEKVKADFSNGILKVQLPKKEETRISREIKIG